MTRHPTRQSSPVGGRNCDGCTLCCKLLSIEELEKPPDSLCTNCEAGAGCRIYAGRPTECRGFYCEYLLDSALGEEWQPSRANMVVSFEDYSNSIVVHVDGIAPEAWRTEPFASQIRQWATTGARRLTQVIVWQGETKFVIASEPPANGEAA